MLARWKPKVKERRPGQNPPLPPASDRYYELEAMKAFHCSPWDWETLPAVRKAELIAHEQEYNLRTAYGTEEVEKDETMGTLQAMRARLGLGRC